MKEMDEMPTRQKAMAEAMGADRLQSLMKGTGDTFVSIETNLFAVNPRMSYVSKDVEDAAPEFWRPKPAAKPASAPKPKEGTGQ
jgi:hypothetical protein